jgi:hypothetical protein
MTRIMRRIGVTMAAGLATAAMLGLASYVFAGGARPAAVALFTLGGEVAQPQPAKEPKPTEATKPGCGSNAPEIKPVAVQGTPAPEAVPTPSGPPPKWVCEAPTINLEPIWSGKPITAVWVVKNTGEGDLIIKIKGG